MRTFNHGRDDWDNEKGNDFAGMDASQMASQRKRHTAAYTTTRTASFRRYKPVVRKLNSQWFMDEITSKVHLQVFACKCKQDAPPGWVKFDLSPKEGHAYVSLVTGDKRVKRPHQEACAYKASCATSAELPM